MVTMLTFYNCDACMFLFFFLMKDSDITHTVKMYVGICYTYYLNASVIQRAGNTHRLLLIRPENSQCRHEL